MALQLSEHFTLGEFLKSDTAEEQDIVNAPNWDAIVQMVLLANNTLEGIRELVGPMTITSGFRNGALNEAVGGAEDSAHKLGAAADFVCPEFSVDEVIALIEPHMEELQIDQLINEYGSWVHVGRAQAGEIPRNSCFTVE